MDKPSLYGRLTKYPALALLGVVYVVSALVVFSNWQNARSGAGETDRVVLRMAHWQLEPGIRDALDWAAGEYRRLHPNVEVRQILVPEQGYFQWVNTQLIGNTAPDMIECGLGGSWELWQKFYARYFIPLDEYVDAPNPYNEGTQHEGVPWRLTYFDEMEGGYQETLQSYFQVTLSAFTVRLYYNRDMVAEVWPPEPGGPEFPENFEQFVQLCERLEAAHEGEEFVPVAGTTYSFERIESSFQTGLTANYLDRLDRDFSGTVSRMESAGPVYEGKVDFLEPPIRASFELLRRISEYSPPGATAMTRDEAVFLFLQGHAAMIPTGSWDYSALAVDAEFDLDVADVPLPAKDDPEYGPYVVGLVTEADTRAYFPFGITKNSRHVGHAVDFLRFIGSLKINEELNQRMFWIPAILGARPRKELEPFMPRVEGFSTALEFHAPNTKLAYDQQKPLYLQGKKPYEEFVQDYMAEYRNKVPEGARDHVRDITLTIADQMRSVALRRAAMEGMVGADAPLTGDPQLQYKRLAEAFGGQIATREHEARVWMDSFQPGSAGR